MEVPFFSIIVVVTDATAHVAAFTLDSIAFQSFSAFELIVVDGRKKQHHAGLLNDYRKYITKIIPTDETNLFRMMNEGLSSANGKYVHFLNAGEFYLFRHVLAKLEQAAAESKLPELIYSGHLLRHSLAPTQNILKEMTILDLKMGRLPNTLQFFWFERLQLLKMEGLNTRYQLQAGFDLICRYFLISDLRKVFIKRILTDYEYLKSPSKKIIRQFGEMLFLLWFHFGISRALFSWAVKNYLNLMQWWIKHIKIAFWGRTV